MNKNKADKILSIRISNVFATFIVDKDNRT